MTKEELMEGIYDMDPSYRKLRIDLNQYTEEQLQICYDRKKNAPIQRRRAVSGGWYDSYVPTTRVRKTEVSDTDYYEVPVTEAEDKSKGVALTGFDALRKD